MNVSVVIPVWNGRAQLEKLLVSLKRQTVLAFETIVVDNGSLDGAGDLAGSWGAQVIRFERNCGFAAAVNRGVAESKAELVAILNSDVELEPDWTANLEAALHHPNIWFATGLLVTSGDLNRIDGSWDLVSKAGMPWRAGNGHRIKAPFLTDRQIQIASFTAILLKRSLWERVGPLDERFESYLEDVDFGIRCAAEKLTGQYVASARARHQGSATLGRWNGGSVRRMSRNQCFLVRKYIGLRFGWWGLFVGQILWGAVAARHGAGLDWIQGKWEGWKRREEFPVVVLPELSLFRSQEREIVALQHLFGFDWYWRWYARLTGAVGRIDTGRGDD